MKMQRKIIDGNDKTAGTLSVSIENHTDIGSPVIFILLGEQDEQEEILNHLSEYKAQAVFVFISGFDWNRDLSPWSAPAAWKDTPDFSGGADAFLEELTGRVLLEVRERMGYEPLWHGIAGYSLAGLFAVYSLYRTDVFRRAASVSGSMWFDGFREYAVSHSFAGTPDMVYFSLGAKESHTRNRRVAAVEEDTRMICGYYQDRGMEAVFEMNPGNHFQNPQERLAKGISRILRH